MEEKKKLRCPLGVPGGIIAALIGLAGIIFNIINLCWMGMATSLALLLIALPFIRVTMMIHTANDRLDKIEAEMEKK
ncbi:MAG: hypothetical protein IH598_14910 [Bacteroidales bacterium]|nr:hypothetical protein [Bacteroidales bacterium]